MRKFEISKKHDKLLSMLNLLHILPENKHPSYVLINDIRKRREALSMSQDELSEAVGCSLLTLQKVEEFDYIPSLTLALVFAAYFDCQVEEIFTFRRITNGIT